MNIEKVLKGTTAPPLRDEGILNEGYGRERSWACVGRGVGLAAGRGKASVAGWFFAPGGPPLSGPGEIPVGHRIFV